MLHPKQNSVRRQELVAGQRPFAAILGCSDYRVPPEQVFDQGLGDLFVTRVAGGVPGVEVIGSLEYGVEHLGMALIVVLGHSNCGALASAVNAEHAPGDMGALLQALAPAVEKSRDRAGDPVENAVREHIAMTVARLRSSEPVLARLVREGRLRIVGGYYDLRSGVVEFD